MTDTKKKTLIEYFHEAKEVISFLFLVAGIGASFAYNQSDMSKLKQEVGELKGDSKTIIELKSDLKNLSKNVDEIKTTNRDTYMLLLDMQRKAK